MTPRPDAATYFGARTTLYDDRYDARSADGHALRARMKVVLQLIGDGPGVALDAGMGPGRLCAELTFRGWEVSGVDASAEMVETARRRLPVDSERLRCAEIEALPFDAESFDVVAATGVLEYADLMRALSELERVLRPGGLMVVSYPNPRALYGIWKTHVFYRAVRGVKRLGRRADRWMPRGGRAISPARFADLLRDRGMDVESVEYSSYLLLPTPLDSMFPRTVARFGERLEGAGPHVARLLATQVVYAGRKAA